MAAVVVLASCEVEESCEFKNDGECDETYGLCPVGTDTADCAEEHERAEEIEEGIQDTPVADCSNAWQLNRYSAQLTPFCLKACAFHATGDTAAAGEMCKLLKAFADSVWRGPPMETVCPVCVEYWE